MQPLKIAKIKQAVAKALSMLLFSAIAIKIIGQTILGQIIGQTIIQIIGQDYQEYMEKHAIGVGKCTGNSDRFGVGAVVGAGVNACVGAGAGKEECLKECQLIMGGHSG